jgi:hypothetical protein
LERRQQEQGRGGKSGNRPQAADVKSKAARAMGQGSGGEAKGAGDWMRRQGTMTLEGSNREDTRGGKDQGKAAMKE